MPQVARDQPLCLCHCRLCTCGLCFSLCCWLIDSLLSVCLSALPAHQSSLTSKPKKAPSSDSGPSPLLLPCLLPGASPRDQDMEEAPLNLCALNTHTHEDAPHSSTHPLLISAVCSCLPPFGLLFPFLFLSLIPRALFLGFSILVTWWSSIRLCLPFPPPAPLPSLSCSLLLLSRPVCHPSVFPSLPPFADMALAPSVHQLVEYSPLPCPWRC